MLEKGKERGKKKMEERKGGKRTGKGEKKEKGGKGMGKIILMRYGRINVNNKEITTEGNNN